MSLYVDLTAIKNNIKTIKEATNKEIMAVIKSDAYGLGSNHILPTLYDAGVNWIVYNTYKEYLHDKDYIINNKIKVLILESPTLMSIKDDYQYLIYSINTIDDLNCIKKSNKIITIHLRVNTGMNRLGINDMVEFEAILDDLQAKPNIIIDGIYTHFASNEDEYEYYHKQQNLFLKYIEKYNFKHIHSTCTSSLHKNIIGNMIRVGLALYGYGNHHLNLNPSLVFTTSVVSSFLLKKGECVGYDMTYISSNKEYLNVIPLGYNEIQGITNIQYKNKKYKLIGKTCMNHAFFVTPFKINKISKLLVLSKNDIIIMNYNWYHILTSLKKVPKNYIKRGQNDISSIYQRTNPKNQRYIFRRRSNQNTSFGTIRFRWC